MNTALLALTACLPLLLANPAQSRPKPPKPQKMAVRVTFYSAASDPSGKTATGRAFRLPGCAVDRSVIPYGSRVTVPGHGTFLSDDSGRLIVGRRIDVRLPLASRSKLRRLGVQHLTVLVHRPAKKQGR